MLGETLWGAIRSPGNTSGSLLIGSFNEETGAFTMLWNVVRVPTNVNVNVGLAALRRVCPADFNEDGTVSSQDFFDFLPAFFAEMPEGDFDRDGRINSQDFFDFLAAFFAGC